MAHAPFSKAYEWKLSPLPRRSQQGRYVAARLEQATRILSDATGMDSVRARICINSNVTFFAPFRAMVQRHDTLRDCGYHARIVWRYRDTGEIAS